MESYISTVGSQPLSFLQWIQAESFLSTDINLNLKKYNDYFKEWSKKINDKNVNEDDIFKQLYINLIKDISVKYTTEEEKRFISNFDFTDKINLDIIIPFFVKKIKSICLYYASKREKIKEIVSLLPYKGTSFSVTQTVKNILIEGLEKESIQKLLEGKSNVPSLSAIIKNLNITVDELYSEDTTSVDESINHINDLLGLEERIDIEPDLYLNFKDSIITAIQQYPVFLSELLGNIGVNVPLSGDELFYLKERDFINYIKSNDSKNLTIDLKKKLAPKYSDCRFYYLSVGNTVTDIVSGVLFDTDEDSFLLNQGNNSNPSYKLSSSLKELYTSYELGKFFIPSKLGLLKYNTFNKKIEINYNKLSPNTTYSFPDPDIRESADTPLVYKIDLTWNKRNSEENFRFGDVITGKGYNLFYAYESLSQDVISQPYGLSFSTDNISFWEGDRDAVWSEKNTWPGLDTVEKLPISERTNSSLIGDEVLCNWGPDIFGNEFGLYKVLGDNYTLSEKHRLKPGRVLIRTAFSSVVSSYDHYFSDIIFKYPLHVRNELKGNIYSFFIYKNIYIIETENFVVIDSYDFNFSTKRFISTLLPGLYIPKHTVNKNLESYVNSFFVSKDNSVYVSFIKLLPSLSASNYKSLYPVIYRIDTETLHIDQVYPGSKLNASFYSLSSLNKSFPEIDLRYIRGTKFAYKEQLNIFTLTYIAYNLNNIPFIVSEQFSVDNGNENLYSYVPVLHKPYYYVYDTNFTDHTIVYRDLGVAGKYSEPVGATKEDGMHFGNTSLRRNNYYFCSDISPVYINFRGQHSVQMDFNRYSFGNLYFGLESVGFAKIENYNLIEFRDNNFSVEINTEDEWVFLKHLNYNNTIYNLSAFIPSNTNRNVVVFNIDTDSKDIDSYKPFSTNLVKTYTTVSIKKIGDGDGVVFAEPYCVDCGDVCDFMYPIYGTITLKPSAFDDSVFAGWVGSQCDGSSNECFLFVTGNTEISAVFTKIPSYTLSITAEQPGHVVTLDGKINYPTISAANYDQGEIVVLSAFNDPSGYIFNGFKPTLCNQERVCVINMSDNTNISATYLSAYFDISVYNSNPAFGTFLISLCGNPYVQVDPYIKFENVNANSVVSISAYYDSTTSSFLGFSGSNCDSFNITNCEFSLTKLMSITAQFTPIKYTVTVKNVATTLGNTGLFYTTTDDGEIDLGTLSLRNTKNKSTYNFTSGSMVNLSSFGLFDTGIYSISSTDNVYIRTATDFQNGDPNLSLNFTVTGNTTFVVTGLPVKFTTFFIKKEGTTSGVITWKSGDREEKLTEGADFKYFSTPLGLDFSIKSTLSNSNTRHLYAAGFSGLYHSTAGVSPIVFSKDSELFYDSSIIVERSTLEGDGRNATDVFTLPGVSIPPPTLPMFTEYNNPVIQDPDISGVNQGLNSNTYQGTANVRMLSVFFYYEQVPQDVVEVDLTSIPNFSKIKYKEGITGIRSISYIQEKKNLIVTSNNNWEIKDLPVWLKATPVRGFSNDTVSLEVINNNPNNTIQSGSFRVISLKNPLKYKTVTVTQLANNINSYNYTTFSNTVNSMYVYEGRSCALMISSNLGIDQKDQVMDFVTDIETTYIQTSANVGTTPLTTSTSIFNNKPIIAVLPVLCDNNCSVGKLGAEVPSTNFINTLNKYMLTKALPYDILIEMIKSFWVSKLGDVLDYKGNNNKTYMQLAFTSFNIFVLYNINNNKISKGNIGSYILDDKEYYIYQSDLNILLRQYNQSLFNWNTGIIEGGFIGSLQLPVYETVTSILIDLQLRFNMMYNNIWVEAMKLNNASTTQDAVDNLVIACSKSVRTNLLKLFTNFYKCTVSPTCTTTINNLRYPDYTNY